MLGLLQTVCHGHHMEYLCVITYTKMNYSACKCSVED